MPQLRFLPCQQPKAPLVDLACLLVSGLPLKNTILKSCPPEQQSSMSYHHHSKGFMSMAGERGEEMVHDLSRLTHLHLEFGRSHYFLLGPEQKNEHRKGLEEMH